MYNRHHTITAGPLLNVLTIYVVDVCIPTTHIVYGDELTFFFFFFTEKDKISPQTRRERLYNFVNEISFFFPRSFHPPWKKKIKDERKNERKKKEKRKNKKVGYYYSLSKMGKR